MSIQEIAVYISNMIADDDTLQSMIADHIATAHPDLDTSTDDGLDKFSDAQNNVLTEAFKLI